MYIGAEDRLKPVTCDVWVRAYMNETRDTPPFYSLEFKQWADELLTINFNIRQVDITPPLCRDIYVYLSSQDPPTELFE